MAQISYEYEGQSEPMQSAQRRYSPQPPREQNSGMMQPYDRWKGSGGESTEVRGAAWPERGMTAAPTASANNGLHMDSMLSVDMLDGPATSGEILRASLKGLLMRNIGFYIVASFLIGSGEPVSWEGILHSVGTDYILLYQPDVDRYISGDIYSLKFVEFHNSNSKTPWAGYRRRDGGSTGW